MRFLDFISDGYRGKRTKSEMEDYDIVYINDFAESIHNKYGLIDLLKTKNVTNIKQSVEEIMNYIDKNKIPYAYIDNGVLSVFDKEQ